MIYDPKLLLVLLLLRLVGKVCTDPNLGLEGEAENLLL